MIIEIALQTIEFVRVSWQYSKRRQVLTVGNFCGFASSILCRFSLEKPCNFTKVVDNVLVS